MGRIPDFARLSERRGVAGRGAFEWTPEAERMRSALEMHELGVQLYRQRMRREHPEASRAEIDGLVRGWLTALPPEAGFACRQENRVMATPVEAALRRGSR